MKKEMRTQYHQYSPLRNGLSCYHSYYYALQLSDKAVIALSDVAGHSSKAGAGLKFLTLGILKPPCPKGFSCFVDRQTDRTLQQLPGAAASPLCTAPLPPPAPQQRQGGSTWNKRSSSEPTLAVGRQKQMVETKPTPPVTPPALPTSLLQHPGHQHEARQQESLPGARAL